MYIMSTRQESKEILGVSSLVYINIYLPNIYYLINTLEIDFLLSVFKLVLLSCWQTNVQVEDTSRNIS